MQQQYQIRSKTIIRYYQRSGGKPLPSLLQQECRENFEEIETYTGKMTAGATKRLTKAVENLAMLSNLDRPKQHTFISKLTKKRVTITYNLTFITLTLADNENFYEGSECHKTCLEPFLLWLRRKHGVQLYLWKAELQRRGQLHYHITTDRFIPHEEIRAKWNELQHNAGYLETHYKKFGHYNPNGTDIHSVYKKEGIAEYLKKKVLAEHKKRERIAKGRLIGEYTKNVQNRDSVGGKVWDCCQILKSKVAKYYCSVDAAIERRLNEAVAQKKVYAVNTEHCTIFECLGRSSPLNIMTFADKEFFKEHLRNVMAYKRRLPRRKCRDDIPLILKIRPVYQQSLLFAT